MNPLWAQLAAAGLVTGPEPLTRPDTPWYLSAILGFAGWIAAIFLLIFLSLVFGNSVFDGKILPIFVGLALCVPGTLLLRREFHNDFVNQLAFATVVAGQAFVILGIVGTLDNRIASSICAAIFFAVMTWMTPYPPHRIGNVMAFWFALACIYPKYGANLAIPAAAVAALCLLEELRYPRHAALVRAIGYGSAISLLASQSSYFVKEFVYSQAAPTLIPALGIGLVAAVAVYMLSGDRADAAFAVFAICALASNAPGIAASILVIFLGFERRERWLWGIACAAGIVYLSHLYYSLSFTLLQKSAALLASGIALLLLRIPLLKKA